MTMLSDITEKFCQSEQELDPGDAVAYGMRLEALTKKLATDAAGYVADYAMGEVSSLMARIHGVLAWLAAEREDINDRQRRYGRQQAVLSLLLLAEGIRRFHTGRRRDEDVDALRALVGSALAGLVPEEE
jgi:hypothetical protein